MSARIQRFQIRFLWLLNQFLGYKWKRGGTMTLPRIKAVGVWKHPKTPLAFLKALESPSSPQSPSGK